MLEIEYKGANSVVFSTKNSKLITDPKLSLVGLKDVVVKDAIELATEARFLTKADAFISLEGPGEYEVGDFSIRGITAKRHIDHDETKQTTLYRIEVGEFRVGLIGNIDPKITEEQLELIGVIDILVLPVGGGGYTLDAHAAATIVRQIEPKTVIPIHYAQKDVAYEVPQDDVNLFVKELGAEVEKVGSKYKLKNTAMLKEALSVIEIERS